MRRGAGHIVSPRAHLVSCWSAVDNSSFILYASDSQFINDLLSLNFSR